LGGWAGFTLELPLGRGGGGSVEVIEEVVAHRHPGLGFGHHLSELRGRRVDLGADVECRLGCETLLLDQRLPSIRPVRNIDCEL